MELISCEINILLTLPEECITVTGGNSNDANIKPKFAITDTKTLCFSCDIINSI